MSNLDSTEIQFQNGEHRATIQQAEVGQRLDRFLTGMLGSVSRNVVQQLINEGYVLINNRPGKPGYLLRLNDEVEVLRTSPTTQNTVKPQALPLDIIYEDDDLLVLNKAAGVVVHPAAGHHEDTLVNALLAYNPALQGVGEDMRPGIVHRLDKDTSGLMLVAKHTRSLTALSEQMAQHKIMKRYQALVEGVFSLDQGSIDAPIGRDPRHRQQMAITTMGSREARTHFRVLQRFARHTLLLLQLETGRTHQIRVHLKAIGHPVVGDPVYGSGNTRFNAVLKRQFLHAYQLKLDHPISGIPLEFEAPLPPDLEFVLTQKNLL